MLSYVEINHPTKITNLVTYFRQFFYATTVYLVVGILRFFMNDTRWIE